MCFVCHVFVICCMMLCDYSFYFLLRLAWSVFCCCVLLVVRWFVLVVCVSLMFVLLFACLFVCLLCLLFAVTCCFFGGVFLVCVPGVFPLLRGVCCR